MLYFHFKWNCTNLLFPFSSSDEDDRGVSDSRIAAYYN